MSEVDGTVVVVNYNAGPDLGRCLDSVAAQTGVRFDVVVVDNASADRSADEIGARLIRNAENRGFGPANNQGAREARGRHLLLLNPDARFEAPDALRRLVERLDASPAVGLLAPRLLDLEGREQPPYAEYPRQRHALRFDLPGALAWVLGAAMLVRRELFEAIGGFDEGFFLYGEDADLCLRIRRAGFEIAHAPEVTVRHVGGTSEAAATAHAKWTRKQQGLHRFFELHYPPEAVRRIARRDLAQAGYRRLLLGSKLALGLASAEDRAKLERYRAISETSRALLSRLR